MALAFKLLTKAAVLAMGVSFAGAGADSHGAGAVIGDAPAGTIIAGRATSAPPQLGTTGASRGRTSAPPQLGTTGRTHGSGLDTGVGSGAGSFSQRGGRGK